jgi:hypothetical protein
MAAAAKHTVIFRNVPAAKIQQGDAQVAAPLINPLADAIDGGAAPLP